MAKTVQNRSYELKKLKAECVAEENRQYLHSQKVRQKGSKTPEAGNVVTKMSRGQVFLFIIGAADNADANNLAEQFKSSRNFRKTKRFNTARDLLLYIHDCKFPPNSILIAIDVMPADEQALSVAEEYNILSEIKKDDPCLDIMVITADARNKPCSAIDFYVQKNSETFAKILTNITWSIREQDRIRKQIESKQFIKMAVIGFLSLIVLLLLIDLVSGFLSEMHQPLLGIVPASIFQP